MTPSFKKGENYLLTNYRPISVLPCFSKILERLMYNKLYSYLTENNILFNLQFGFRNKHSTEHAIIELVDNILNGFSEDKYTLGVFIDLSKAFDTVDHQILLAKLNMYGIQGKSLQWFESYLSERKQYIEIDRENTSYLDITCGVPQGSILGPLLFLIYINDLSKVSNIITPIMFADDTNLFYSDRNIKNLFEKMNIELQKVSEWLRANKLSINIGKTNFLLFHKSRDKDNLPLKLPILEINNVPIKRISATKFLGVQIDENINWTQHITLTENKMAKQLGILYKARPYLNQKSMISLYYSFFHTYLNYGNIAWASTSKTKLKKLYSQQKQAVKTVFNEDILASSKILFSELNALNIYKINIFQNLVFMFKTRMGINPDVFNNKFQNIDHYYPTRFSENNYYVPHKQRKFLKYAISSRAPNLWNTVLPTSLKFLDSLSLFKNKLKDFLINIENEQQYF